MICGLTGLLKPEVSREPNTKRKERKKGRENNTINSDHYVGSAAEQWTPLGQILTDWKIYVGNLLWLEGSANESWEFRLRYGESGKAKEGDAAL